MQIEHGAHKESRDKLLIHIALPENNFIQKKEKTSDDDTEKCSTKIGVSTLTTEASAAAEAAATKKKCR